MKQDIVRVPIADSIPEKITLFPRLQERLASSLFFTQITLNEYYLTDQERYQKASSWLIWASVVALSSIEESITIDMEACGKRKRWKESKQRKAIQNDPLVATLKELRNYEIHFEFRKNRMKVFQPLIQSADGKFKKVCMEEELYFYPIDITQLQKLHNFKRNTTKVSSEMIQWFNRQVANWPAAYLLGEARRNVYLFVAEFAKENEM